MRLLFVAIMALPQCLGASRSYLSSSGSQNIYLTNSAAAFFKITIQHQLSSVVMLRQVRSLALEPIRTGGM
ncbi:hypothetical protein ASD02_23140 [Ensifer sp. Root1252]|nr:hypothetical protein ASD02_23140 [Ensifer sp. Root1252]KRC77938.1 hypothetical protein ASE32_27750 [Ensifer sp. Root231]KRD00358.1 hypothetical protein ASE47_23710 [Ensifer sp. Root258]